MRKIDPEVPMIGEAFKFIISANDFNGILKSSANIEYIFVHARRSGLYDASDLNNVYIHPFTSLNEDGPFPCVDKDTWFKKDIG